MEEGDRKMCRPEIIGITTEIVKDEERIRYDMI
jgi:hypothetical protein